MAFTNFVVVVGTVGFQTASNTTQIDASYYLLRLQLISIELVFYAQPIRFFFLAM